MIFHGWDLGEGVTSDTARVVPLPPPGLARSCTWSWDRGHSLILSPGPQFARVLIPFESEVTIPWDPPFGHPVPAPLGGSTPRFASLTWVSSCMAHWSLKIGSGGCSPPRVGHLCPRRQGNIRIGFCPLPVLHLPVSRPSFDSCVYAVSFHSLFFSGAYPLP